MWKVEISGQIRRYNVLKVDLRQYNLKSRNGEGADPH